MNIIKGVDSSGRERQVSVDFDGRLISTSNPRISSVTNTRPADTTAYAVNDVVSTLAGAVMEFANIGPANGVILITQALLTIKTASVASGMGNQRLFLFTSAPTAIADNSAFDISTTDVSKLAGWIDLGTPIDNGATIATQNISDRLQIALTGTSLYGIRVTTTAYTPTSAEESTITLHAVEV